MRCWGVEMFKEARGERKDDVDSPKIKVEVFTKERGLLLITIKLLESGEVTAVALLLKHRII
jgi:hypothetical protein